MKIPEKFASSPGGRAGVESELGVLKRYPAPLIMRMYDLRISLIESGPEIWRRVRVPHRSD